ncbi:type II toxin-antitoxin system RelB/DinJ family antitoxin [Salmonella enterica]|nr:type II toxin-antitoxin system RelB/DinJ family antitoxin [Salmonella enterica subsp. enterica]
MTEKNYIVCGKTGAGRTVSQKKSMINVRIDEDLKKKAEAVLTEQGMTTTDAVTALYRFIAEHGRMPVQSRVVMMDDAVEMLLFAKSDSSQLERVYGEKTTSALLANTNLKIILAENSPQPDTEPQEKQDSGTDKQ